mgnify:CR=1 FL=1
MATTLRPAQAVRCPLTGKAVFVSECRECKYMIEVRSPWRYYAVKCDVETMREASV